MTKKFEEIILGNSAEVLEKLKIKKFKGEVVVIFE
jgi:16S rRNA C1402 (ribose-2'-O) methylase RsmI